MELKDELVAFYEIVEDDARIATIHISLYMAILWVHLQQNNANPIKVYRAGLMRAAKISGRSTFYKTMRDLQSFGLIRYMPSFNLYQGSQVYLRRL